MSLGLVKQYLFPGPRISNGINPRKPKATIQDEKTPQTIKSTGSGTTLTAISDTPDDLESQKQHPSTLRTPGGLDDAVVKEKSKGFKPSTRVIQDAILGISDGMTVPFALTAGLSSLGTTRLVIIGGVAELCAGAISMGLGAYLAARTEAIAYFAELAETRTIVEQDHDRAQAIVQNCLKAYLPTVTLLDATISAIMSSTELSIAFIMRFSCQVIQPDSVQPTKSALAMGLGYAIGGLLPLIPYFAVSRNQVYLALWWSIGVMVLALLVFGYGKTGVTSGWAGKVNVLRCVRGAVEMLVIGGLAAGAAVGITRGINSAFHGDVKS